MSSNQVLFLCSYADSVRIRPLVESLREMGISANMPEDLYSHAHPASEPVYNLIANARAIAFFFSTESINNNFLIAELLSSFDIARQLDKRIIPIVEWNTILSQNPTLKQLLSTYQIIFPEDGLHSQQDYTNTAGLIYESITTSDTKELLYEKITNLSRIKYTPGVSKSLSELLLLLCDEASNNRHPEKRRSIYKEILQCMEQLSHYGETGYSPEQRELAHKRLDAVNKVETIIQGRDFQKLDLFLIAFAITVNYFDYLIREDVIDTLSYGDVHGVSSDTLQSKYLTFQNFYLKMYNSQLVSERISDSNHGPYPEDEVAVILQVRSRLIGTTAVVLHTKSNFEPKITDSQSKLYAIAEYMRKANVLFEQLNTSSVGADFLRCLKTSYERLRLYCEITGCLSVCAECIERIAEINQQLESMDESSADNSTVGSGMKALLGFSQNNTDSYDVFISYKHEDIAIAKRMYHFFKSNIIHPFLDTFSLPELSKSEYEDAIMNAIDKAKHFIVVITNLEYLHSHWVELEMKTFRHEMVEGRKKDANFIIVVTNNVYNEIIRTNKQCLPIHFRSYEIMRVDTYRSTIISYLR